MASSLGMWRGHSTIRSSEAALAIYQKVRIPANEIDLVKRSLPFILYRRLREFSNAFASLISKCNHSRSLFSLVLSSQLLESNYFINNFIPCNRTLIAFSVVHTFYCNCLLERCANPLPNRHCCLFVSLILSRWQGMLLLCFFKISKNDRFTVVHCFKE